MVLRRICLVFHMFFRTFKPIVYPVSLFTLHFSGVFKSHHVMTEIWCTMWLEPPKLLDVFFSRCFISTGARIFP